MISVSCSWGNRPLNTQKICFRFCAKLKMRNIKIGFFFTTRERACDFFVGRCISLVTHTRLSLQILCNTQWMISKLRGRPFREALSDINLVLQKDIDIRLIQAILLASRFLPQNPDIFQLELLSRFSRASRANSAVIERMVAEAATMVMVSAERCLVPFYPCVAPFAAGLRRPAQYGPTHVLAAKRQPSTDEDSADATTALAVVWGECCGLQVWRTDHSSDAKFRVHYHISSEVPCLFGVSCYTKFAVVIGFLRL